MSSLEEFESTLKEVVHANRLSSSKITKLTEIAMKSMESDTQLVSLLYRTHKSLSPAEKVNSLYVFDAIVRKARRQVTKHNISANSEKGNPATFLSKMEGVLDGLFKDMASVSSSSVKEKTQKILDIWSKGNTFPPAVLSHLTEITQRQRLDPRKDSSKDASTFVPPISTTPPGAPPIPVAVPPPPSSSLQDAQATLMALLAKAAQTQAPGPVTNGTTKPNTINLTPQLDGVQMSLLQQVQQLAQAQIARANPPSQPRSSANTTTTPPPPLPVPTYPTKQDAQSSAFNRPNNFSNQPEKYNIRHEASTEHGYGRDSYGDNRGFPPRGGFRGGFRGRGRGRGNWNDREPSEDRARGDWTSPPRPRRSRSRSPPPRGSSSLGRRRDSYSAPDITSAPSPHVKAERTASAPQSGKDEFGRDLRPDSPTASSMSQDTPTRTPQKSPHPPLPAQLTTTDPRQNKPTPPQKDATPPEPPATTSQNAPSDPAPSAIPSLVTPANPATSQLGIESFDISTFNFMDPKSWETVGNMWQVSYGYMPSQEELMQFVIMRGAVMAQQAAMPQQSDPSNVSEATMLSQQQKQQAGGMGSVGYSHGTGMMMTGGFGNGIGRDNQKQWNHNVEPSSAIVLSGGQGSQSSTSTENRQQSTPSSAGGRMQRVGDKWMFVRDPVPDSIAADS